MHVAQMRISRCEARVSRAIRVRLRYSSYHMPGDRSDMHTSIEICSNSKRNHFISVRSRLSVPET
jgi:hypothetical protein